MSGGAIHFDQQVCSRLDLALTREWLETNGLGGFASSTIVGLNTRRYHGLLTAAATPPAGRVLLLSKLEETLIVGEQRFDLAANEYPGAVHPQGHTLMKEFRLDPFPTFVYSVAGLEDRKASLHGARGKYHGHPIPCASGERRSAAGMHAGSPSPDRVPGLSQHHPSERCFEPVTGAEVGHGESAPSKGYPVYTSLTTPTK